MNKKQLKITVNPAIVVAFKSACITHNVSMTEELTKFMSERTKILIQKSQKHNRLENRGGRRKELSEILLKLEKIKDNEDDYKSRIPMNLQNGPAYDSASNTVELLEQAIELLYEAFD